MPNAPTETANAQAGDADALGTALEVIRRGDAVAMILGTVLGASVIANGPPPAGRYARASAISSGTVPAGRPANTTSATHTAFKTVGDNRP